MSMRSLSSIALQRDVAKPKRATRNPASGEETEKTELQKRGDVLVAMIPTEPLAAYTATVAVVVAQIGSGEPEDQYMEIRWGLFGAFFIGIPIYLLVTYIRNRSATRHRALPFAEMISGTLAFGAWGLVMPGSPLSALLDGSAEAITIGLITILSAFVLATASGSALEKQATTTG